MFYKRWVIIDNLSDMIEFLGNEFNYKYVVDYLVYYLIIIYIILLFVKEIVVFFFFFIESEFLEFIREVGWYIY